MNATEIQTLEVARELALKKITDNRVNRLVVELSLSSVE